jgi:seryl-tRNA synthetase
MLSLDFISQHPQVIREALRRRQDTLNIDEIIQLAEQRRALITENDGLYASLKPLKEHVRHVSLDSRSELNEQIKSISQTIRQVELRISDVDTRLQMLQFALPNIPHYSVRDGSSEADDQELHRWGEPVNFRYEPKAHWELGERLGIIDAESGVRVAGSRFVTLKNGGARLERALIAFMLDMHTREHGYSEVIPPHLVKRSAMVGAGQLPKFEDQAYACPEDELYLNPTAEVPLVGMHASTIFAPDELPRRYVAWTTAYRREAGSASRQTRGLLRLHQFNKVELFQFVAPQDSYSALEQMQAHAEAVLHELQLPYRVVALCTGNLPFAATKTIDISVWMPALQEYVEVSSVSNCEAFQAYRADIKYRTRVGARAEYVHTLNGSGLAVGRTMAAVLENYQQADGSVIIPKVLRPYMGISLLAAGQV